MSTMKLHINKQLFKETTHSPALIDIAPAGEQKLITDFCFIANPYYPTPKMMDELLAKIPEALKAYPSSNPKIAQVQLAKLLGVNPDYLILGNGSTELITIIEQEFFSDLAIPVPTFSEYLEKMNSPEQIRLYQLPADNAYALNLKDYASWIKSQKVSAALIINPGNPTGQLIGKEDMLAFIREMANLKCILIDESFLDFSGVDNASVMDELTNYPNVIVLRSMSKHCGVPGLRLGYCCTSNPDFLAKMHHRLPAWNINSIAECFLEMLADSNDQYWQSVKMVVEDTRLLENKLRAIPGIKVYPTGSNFILVKIKWGANAQTVQMDLLENYGAYVRDCTNKTGIDDYHIRVSSHGRVDDELLIHALTELSKAAGC